MLPALEENHWTQQATAYEESIIDRRFRTIMDHTLRPINGDTLSSKAVSPAIRGPIFRKLTWKSRMPNQ